MLVRRIFRSQHVAQGGGGTIVQVWCGAPQFHESRSVELVR
jgi:hypothetical protein